MSQKEKRRKSNVKEEKGREGYDDIIYRTACFRLSTAEAEGSLRTLPWVSPISSPQALQSQLLSNLYPSLSEFITRGAMGEKGRLHNLRHCEVCPPAQSPDCTLLSCMSRLAPFFNSKRVASTLLTAAAQ